MGKRSSGNQKQSNSLSKKKHKLGKLMKEISNEKWTKESQDPETSWEVLNLVGETKNNFA